VTARPYTSDQNTDFESSVVRESRPLVEIVHVFGEIDLASVAGLSAAIDAAAEASTTVIVDLTPCRYIDSTTLSALIRANQLYAGRFLVVVPPGGLVHRLLSISSLLEHLPVIASLEGYDS